MNNFVMRRAGTNESWSQRIPSGEGTLTGSAQFEVKPTANNNSTFDLTGTLEVQLVGSSKRLECKLRQKGHYQSDEDPGKQYHFYFRGKADTDQNIFIGIECDGRLLSAINNTNSDISDYQTKVSGGSDLARTAEIYVDIFSYYLQGTKNAQGQYVFVDDAANRIMVPLSITNLPEWLRLDRLVEITGISDGGVSNCSCYRATFICEQLTNFNEDGEPTPDDPNWTTRFPLDTPDGFYRGISRNKTLRIQPQFGNQKEINFKQYGGYRQDLLYGKQLELSDTELSQASSGYYQLMADNTGQMSTYNKSTLNQLPKIDFGTFSWPNPRPTLDFIFKLGDTPTSTPYTIISGSTSIDYYYYLGYPWVLSGLHIINTLDYGDNEYDTLRSTAFHNVINGTPISGAVVGRWVYFQSDVVKNKLGVNVLSICNFYLDVISLNDLYKLNYIDVPTRLTGDIHTLRSPRDQGNTIPYINIPTIINGKRSLTSPEAQGYLEWMNNFYSAWQQKLHPTSTDPVLVDTLLGDSANIYLLIPRIECVGTPISGARLNEWIPVEAAEITMGQASANPAYTNISWAYTGYHDDSSNIFDIVYDEVLQFRFKIIS